VPLNKRNSFEREGWTLFKARDLNALREFDCGDPDLNEYFQKDVFAHREHLLAETYAFAEATEELTPVAFFSLCNDSVKIENIKDSVILPPQKQYPFLPAVKIARFGVYKDLQDNSIGSFAINMIKLFFLEDNRTGCRLITVDAYNKEDALRFYQRNGFQFFNNKDKLKVTRAMFFDLKRLSP
jgi:GNAT superfamily N-acetyltransferase